MGLVPIGVLDSFDSNLLFSKEQLSVPNLSRQIILPLAALQANPPSSNMSQPIVIAFHLTWTAYGYWLPNDPRGSMSSSVASDVIAELGELHFGRKRVQPAGWLVKEFRERAAEMLKFPILRFTAEDVGNIAASLSEVVRQQQNTCYACAIMPDHHAG
jgi:hypothetical protein